jgi:hypothetical protein
MQPAHKSRDEGGHKQTDRQSKKGCIDDRNSRHQSVKQVCARQQSHVESLSTSTPFRDTLEEHPYQRLGPTYSHFPIS